MLRSPFRRLVTALVIIANASACSFGSSEGASVGPPGGSGGFPLTVAHKFGSAEIPAEPERVVSVGYTDHDVILALGVRPVAVREFFGGQPNATWPWAQDELGEADPEVLGVGDLNFERIAALRPDLIIGLSSGMQEHEYRRLSQIAPTVAQSAEYVDFGVPWQEQTRDIGRALGRAERADEVVADLESRFIAVGEQHPEFDGATAIVVRPSTNSGEFLVYGSRDGRSRFLTSLGFVIVPSVAQLAGEQLSATISSERLPLLDMADVVLWVVETPQQQATVQDDPVYQQLAVARDGRSVFASEQVAAALSFNTVLSLPLVLDELVPTLAEAVTRP